MLGVLTIVGLGWGPACGGQVGEGELDPKGGAPNGTGGSVPASGGRASGGTPVPTGGSAGTGGRPNTGGVAVPAGGRPGTGGRGEVGGAAGGGVPPLFVPQQQCYDARGVYLNGTCYRNDPAACMKKVAGITVSCERTCACDECTFEYARCIDDGGCRIINACAELARCRGTAACTNSNCVALIEISGGPSSLGSRLFDQYSACMVKAGCSCTPD